MKTSLAPRNFWQFCAELYWELPKIFKSHSCQVLRYNARLGNAFLLFIRYVAAYTITIYPLVNFQTWKFWRIAHVLGTYLNASRNSHASATCMHLQLSPPPSLPPFLSLSLFLFLSSLPLSSDSMTSRMFAKLTRSRFLIEEELSMSLRKRASWVSNPLKSVLLL